MAATQLDKNPRSTRLFLTQQVYRNQYYGNSSLFNEKFYRHARRYSCGVFLTCWCSLSSMFTHLEHCHILNAIHLDAELKRKLSHHPVSSRFRT